MAGGDSRKKIVIKVDRCNLGKDRGAMFILKTQEKMKKQGIAIVNGKVPAKTI